MLAVIDLFNWVLLWTKKVMDFGFVVLKTASVLNWVPASGIYNLILTRKSKFLHYELEHFIVHMEHCCQIRKF